MERKNILLFIHVKKKREKYCRLINKNPSTPTIEKTKNQHSRCVLTLRPHSVLSTIALTGSADISRAWAHAMLVQVRIGLPTFFFPKLSGHGEEASLLTATRRSNDFGPANHDFLKTFIISQFGIKDIFDERTKAF